MDNSNVSKRNLVVCGDSFAIGIGCLDLYNEPFGSLLAKRLNLNLINLAKGSSSNFSIRLQAVYALQKIQDIDLMIVSSTSYNRTEWFPNGTTPDVVVRNENVNYHQYPPYGENSYIKLLPNPMQNDAEYTGEMLTENYYGIVDYVDTFLDPNKYSGYYTRFQTEPAEKMRLLKQYYIDIHDDKIKKWYDIGILSLTHTMLKNAKIPHLILSEDLDCMEYIAPENVCDISWGMMSAKYPDKIKSLHPSEEGQREVYEKVLTKILTNGWIK